MTNDVTTGDPQIALLVTGIVLGIFIGIWLHKHFVSNRYLEELEDYREDTPPRRKRKPYMKMYFDDDEWR